MGFDSWGDDCRREVEETLSEPRLIEGSESMLTRVATSDHLSSQLALSSSVEGIDPSIFIVAHRTTLKPTRYLLSRRQRHSSSKFDRSSIDHAILNTEPRP